MVKIEFSALELWGEAKTDAPVLAWSWVVEQLQTADDYWLLTAGPAGPTPRPVWGLWIENHLMLSVGSTVHWRNLAASDRVAVHLGDTHEVVIVEGHARQETNETELARVVAPYNQKYDWDWEPGKPFGSIVAVDPAVVLAWRAAPTEEAKTAPFPLAAGKWTFQRDG
jgi:hypothetical protein